MRVQAAMYVYRLEEIRLFLLLVRCTLLICASFLISERFTLGTRSGSGGCSMAHPRLPRPKAQLDYIGLHAYILTSKRSLGKSFCFSVSTSASPARSKRSFMYS